MTDIVAMTDEQKEYEERKKAARDLVADTLAEVLLMFSEDEMMVASKEIAAFVLGYLGVSWGPIIGK